MNKELLRDAVSIMETWWARFPQDMSASDRTVIARMQSAIDAPEPYDQQALELCETCGWKALVPGDCCLNCTRTVADLTDEEILEAPCGINSGTMTWLLGFARAVLAAQKAKT